MGQIGSLYVTVIHFLSKMLKSPSQKWGEARASNGQIRLKLVYCGAFYVFGSEGRERERERESEERERERGRETKREGGRQGGRGASLCSGVSGSAELDRTCGEILNLLPDKGSQLSGTRTRTLKSV